MKKLMITAAALAGVSLSVLAPSVAHAGPDSACDGTAGAARLACLQRVQQQLQQNQNGCGDSTGCGTGGIPGLIYQGCAQAGVC